MHHSLRTICTAYGLKEAKLKQQFCWNKQAFTLHVWDNRQLSDCLMSMETAACVFFMSQQLIQIVPINICTEDEDDQLHNI